MAYEQQVFPEYQLILIRVVGNVSLEENREIGLSLQATLEQSAATLDVFFDLREIGRFPTSIRQLRQTSAVIRNPRLGWILLLTGDHPLLKFVSTVLIQLQTHTGRIRVFDTLNDTISFLHEARGISQQRSDWLFQLRKSLE